MNEIVPYHPSELQEAIPRSILIAGGAGRFAWEEFFSAQIRNDNTRKAYRHAVVRFLTWIESRDIDLLHVTPGMIGQYLDQFPRSIPTKKLHLAALRNWFDALVRRHVVILNPAASVRGERYAVVEGKTPEISPEQARKILDSINNNTLVGKRDKAIIGVLIFTAARAGALSKNP